MLTVIKKYWTVLRVGLVVFGVRLLLRLDSLPILLERLSPRSVTKGCDDGRIKILVGYVDRWLKLFPYNKRGNCFPRSLVLYRFARQLGYPVVFHCGIRKEASSLDGHAWLTLGSEAFYELGPHWQRFTVTFSYPSNSARDVRQISVI